MWLRREKGKKAWKRRDKIWQVQLPLNLSPPSVHTQVSSQALPIMPLPWTQTTLAWAYLFWCTPQSIQGASDAAALRWRLRNGCCHHGSTLSTNIREPMGSGCYVPTTKCKTLEHRYYYVQIKKLSHGLITILNMDYCRCYSIYI